MSSHLVTSHGMHGMAGSKTNMVPILAGVILILVILVIVLVVYFLVIKEKPSVCKANQVYAAGTAVKKGTTETKYCLMEFNNCIPAFSLSNYTDLAPTSNITSNLPTDLFDRVAGNTIYLKRRPTNEEIIKAYDEYNKSYLQGLPDGYYVFIEFNEANFVETGESQPNRFLIGHAAIAWGVDFRGGGVTSADINVLGYSQMKFYVPISPTEEDLSRSFKDDASCKNRYGWLKPYLDSIDIGGATNNAAYHNQHLMKDATSIEKVGQIVKKMSINTAR